MVGNEVISARLARIEECLRRLEEIKNLPLDKFLTDWRAQDIALRNFQIAIESCLDIGSHLISVKGWGSPDSYVRVSEILTEKGVFPKQFLETAIDLAKFRNIIVHEYLYIDFNKVYDKLQQLDNIRQFTKYLVSYFDRK